MIHKKVRKQRTKTRRAVTLVELMVAIVAGLIVILTVGIMLADGHKGFSLMYSRVHSDTVIDSTVARRTFDRIVRKSAIPPVFDETQFDANGRASQVKVDYYYNSSSTVPDSWAEFSLSAGSLRVNYTGAYSVGLVTLADNVSNLTFFHEPGTASVSMIMTIYDADTDENMVVTTTAFLHND